jgi:hypothetical protein
VNPSLLRLVLLLLTLLLVSGTARAGRALHKVLPGESLSTIARRHHMKLALLRRLNPKVGSRLRPGQRLRVIRAEAPSEGSARAFHRLEPGPGFEILDPRHAWGTMLTVTRVAEVLSEHGIRNLEKPPILVGDISRQRGGFLPPHHSHRRGRDVDIRYPRVRPTKHFVPVTAATLDVKRTWSLIHAFILTGDVVYIFVDRRLQKVLYEQARAEGLSKEKLGEIFQYPRGSRAMAGVIRHEPGHATHFHVRFKAEPSEGPNS